MSYISFDRRRHSHGSRRWLLHSSMWIGCVLALVALARTPSFAARWTKRSLFQRVKKQREGNRRRTDNWPWKRIKNQEAIRTNQGEGLVSHSDLVKFAFGETTLREVSQTLYDSLISAHQQAGVGGDQSKSFSSNKEPPKHGSRVAEDIQRRAAVTVDRIAEIAVSRAKWAGTNSYPAEAMRLLRELNQTPLIAPPGSMIALPDSMKTSLPKGSPFHNLGMSREMELSGQKAHQEIGTEFVLDIEDRLIDNEAKIANLTPGNQGPHENGYLDIAREFGSPTKFVTKDLLKLPLKKINSISAGDEVAMLERAGITTVRDVLKDLGEVSLAVGTNRRFETVVEAIAKISKNALSSSILELK